MGRVYPATITLIPILILSIGIANSELSKYINNLLSVKIIGCVTLNVTMFYLLIHINRFFGKEVFERIFFKNEMDMPTTLMLLESNNLMSNEALDKIRIKVQKDFKLPLPTLIDCTANLQNAKRRIVEIVSQIRLKVKNGQLLLQHNIEYGFVRNLIGGAPLALMFSIFNAFYFQHMSKTVFALSIFMCFCWFILISASKFLISRFGELYAKRLIQEYMSK